MKTYLGWGLFVVCILVIVGVIYNIFFHFWPVYPMWAWRYHYFGPRIWSIFPFFGILILIIAGILITGYFFKVLKDSFFPKKDDVTFCPYCGQEIK